MTPDRQEQGVKEVPRSSTPTYRSWESMHRRCRPNYRWRRDYFDRGITVCERWRDFESFLADMGPRPAGTSIDRIDSRGAYEPSNCRWATCGEQTRNRSMTIWIERDGRVQCLKDWAREMGLHPPVLYGRYARGERGDRLFRPIRAPIVTAEQRREICVRVRAGEDTRVLAAEFGVSRGAIYFYAGNAS